MLAMFGSLSCASLLCTPGRRHPVWGKGESVVFPPPHTWDRGDRGIWGVLLPEEVFQGTGTEGGLLGRHIVSPVLTDR